MKTDTRTTRKQGIVMHACPLARNGLLCFLSAQLPNFIFQASASFKDMGHLAELAKADLVVSGINDSEKSTASGVDWLIGLQHMREDKPLVVIAEELPEHLLFELSRQPSLSLLALQTPEPLLSQQLIQILAGKWVISPLLSAMLTTGTPKSEACRLTVAELQVLEFLQAGYSVTQIANRLSRSVKTVSTHKRHVMHKLRVGNEIELFARVKNLNENAGYLDNGQKLVEYTHPGTM